MQYVEKSLNEYVIANQPAGWLGMTFFNLMKNANATGRVLFPFQFPVYLDKGGHLEQEGNRPGNRIGDIQALGCMELGDLDPADADTADTQNGDHHGDEGFAQTPEGTGGHIHETTQKIGQTDNAEPHHAVADGFLGVGNV